MNHRPALARETQPRNTHIPGRMKQHIHSSNLDKALKSILSSNPRSGHPPHEHSPRSSTHTEEIDSGSTSLGHKSEGTTNSSRAGSPVGSSRPEPDLDPFVAVFEQAHQEGAITNELRTEAIALIRHNYAEWVRVNRHLNILKRKIKQLRNPMEGNSPGRPGRKAKRGTGRRGRPLGSNGSPRKVVTSMVGPEPVSAPGMGTAHGRGNLTGTGPNGLTGSYWDIPVEQMGKGARRKSKA
jgi:hypothetical protein